MMCGVQ